MVDKISKFFVSADRVCDYIPVVSTVSNLVDIFEKSAIIPFVSKNSIKDGVYLKHIKKKHALRCVVLLVPVVGNIAIAIYDSCKKDNKARPSQSNNLDPSVNDTISPPNDTISPLPEVDLASSQNDSEEIKYTAFRKRGNHHWLSENDYCPSPADRREQTFKGEPPINEHDNRTKNITLRHDAQPKDNENIDSYLTRVYKEYVNEGGCPRGFVFAGCDFLYTDEGKHPALHFLEEHISHLQSLGIKKIYLEQLLGFHQSAVDRHVDKPYLLHQFFNGELSEPPSNCRGPILDIIKLAKRYGMEVIGTEIISDRANTAGMDNDKRIHNYNHLAPALIREINEPFVVFVGAAHGKLKNPFEPGVSDYLDCPCIGLASTDLNSSVGPGTHRFTGDEFSVDAVFSG